MVRRPLMRAIYYNAFAINTISHRKSVLKIFKTFRWPKRMAKQFKFNQKKKKKETKEFGCLI